MKWLEKLSKDFFLLSWSVEQKEFSLCRRLKDKHLAMQGVWSRWFRSYSLESVRESETYSGLYWIITHHTNTSRWFIESCVSVRTCVWEVFTYRNMHIHLFPVGVNANNPAPTLLCDLVSHTWDAVVSQASSICSYLGETSLCNESEPRCRSVDSLTCFCITWHYRQRVRQPPPLLSQQVVIVIVPHCYRHSFWYRRWWIEWLEGRQRQRAALWRSFSCVIHWKHSHCRGLTAPAKSDHHKSMPGSFK